MSNDPSRAVSIPLHFFSLLSLKSNDGERRDPSNIKAVLKEIERVRVFQNRRRDLKSSVLL